MLLHFIHTLRRLGAFLPLLDLVIHLLLNCLLLAALVPLLITPTSEARALVALAPRSFKDLKYSRRRLEISEKSKQQSGNPAQKE